MNPEEIKIMLNKVISDLVYVRRSQSFGRVVDENEESGLQLCADLDSALLYCRCLKANFGKLSQVEREDAA